MENLGHDEVAAGFNAVITYLIPYVTFRTARIVLYLITGQGSSIANLPILRYATQSVPANFERSGFVRHLNALLSFLLSSTRAAVRT